MSNQSTLTNRVSANSLTLPTLKKQSDIIHPQVFFEEKQLAKHELFGNELGPSGGNPCQGVISNV